MKSNNKKKIREFLRLERMISKVMREVSKNEDKLRNSKEKMNQLSKAFSSGRYNEIVAKELLSYRKHLRYLSQMMLNRRKRILSRKLA